MKTCKTCKIEKDLSEFNKRAAEKDGIHKICRDCINAYKKADYNRSPTKNINRSREYRLKNKEKISAAKKLRYSENPEPVKAAASKWAAENRDRKSAKCKEWREANKEYIKKSMRAWYSENIESVLASNRKRRAISRSADGHHTAADVRALLDNQQGFCANCKAKLFKSGKQKFHVDHIMPLALGGSNWPANLQCLCPRCNMSKGAKHPDEWAKQQGRLL